jgi:hypothetical protein
MTTVITILENDPKYSVYLALLEASGLVSPLQGDGPFTLWAPDNIAMMKLSDYFEANDLIGEITPDYLRNIALCNIISGNITSSDLLGAVGEQITTLTVDEKKSTIFLADDKLFIDTGRLIDLDNEADNGFVHSISFPNGVVPVYPPPQNPELTCSEVTDTTFNVMWQSIDSVYEYQLKVFDDGNIVFNDTYPGENGSTTVLVADLNPNTTHKVQLEIVNTDNQCVVCFFLIECTTSNSISKIIKYWNVILEGLC